MPSDDKMNLNSCYDWGMKIVKKLRLSWPYKSRNTPLQFIPRGVVFLDDIAQEVVFNEDCMGVHYALPSCAVFDYPESHYA